MLLDAFLEKLEEYGPVRPAGTGYVGCCPAHDDREPSLGVSEGDDGLLITCHAGCATEDVLAALGLELRDLFYNAVDYSEPEAVYDYVDEGGTLLFQAVRFPGKQFKQRHRDPETGEWVWNLEGIRRVLYRLPEVLEATRLGLTIYVCEGEKDVEALRAQGKVATCNPMGAGKWREEYADMLAGAATVIIVQDRDEPGRAHAEKAKQSLQGRVSHLHVVQAKTGKDAFDHLNVYGHAVEEFHIVRENRVRRGIVTAREMAESAMEALEFRPEDLPGYQLWDPIPLTFRQGRMYAIGAYTGDGKTSSALQGTRKLCTEGKRGGYFTLEMPEQDLRNKLIAHTGISLWNLENPWTIKADPTLYARYVQAVEEIAEWELDIIFNSEITAEQVVEIARDREHEFVVIDHIHRFGWGSERRKLEEQVMQLTNLALEQNLMLLILCQFRKYQRGKDMEAYPRPTLSDFRETSQIGDDSAISLAIWRERINGLAYSGSTQVIVLKNRHTTGENDKAGRVFFPSFDLSREMFITPEVPVESDGSHVLAA